MGEAMRKQLKSNKAAKNMTLSNCAISSGSVIVDMTMTAAKEKDLTSVLDELAESLTNNKLNIKFNGKNYQAAPTLDVNGETYVIEKKEESGMKGWAIAITILFIILMIGGCLAAAYYILVYRKKQLKGRPERVENP